MKKWLSILCLFICCFSAVSNDTTLVRQLNEQAYQIRRSNQDSAMVLAKKAFQLATEIKDSFGLANASRNLGILASYRSDYQKSIEHHTQSLEISELIGFKKGISNSLNSIGNIYMYQGEYNKCLEKYLEALSIRKEIPDSIGIAMSLGNVGIVYSYQKNYEQTLSFYWQSFKMYEHLDDPEGMCRTMNNIGLVYNSFPDSADKAMEAFKYSMSISKQHGIDIEYLSSLQSIGFLQFELGNYDSALVYLNIPLAFYRENEYQREEATLLYQIGLVLHLQNQHQKAEEYLLKGLQIATEIGAKEDIRMQTEVLSSIYESMGDYQKSLAFYKQFTAVKDSLFNESKSKDLGKLEAQYEMEKKQEEELRMKNEELRIQIEKKNRRDNLQFSGIFVFVLILFAFVFMSGKFSISEKVAEGLIFFTFLLFFEFCLVLVDPLVEEWSSGEPLYKLLFNAVLAGAIFPLHAFFENSLKKRLLKNQ